MRLDEGAKAVGLDVVWARSKIAELERQKRLGGDSISLDQAIEDVAMAHHLVSSQTSLVAVDITPTALQISKDSAVASLAPKGSKVLGQLPQTATPAGLFALLGWLSLGVGLCSLYIRRVR